MVTLDDTKAAQVVRLFRNSTRALQQLHHHPRVWMDTAPHKSAAYRRAAALFIRLTGATLAPVEAPARADWAERQQSFAFA